MEYEFKAFPLTRHNADAWDSLLALNGGCSAPWITAAPGTNHEMHVCCLILCSEPIQRKKLDGEDGFVDITFRKEEWSAYYSRIAILVPVAVHNGIAMAQGVKRLCDTCPCHALKRLGVALLAHSALYFHMEYLFLSPINPFRQHLKRELHANGVPFGEAGYRCLCSALKETENSVDDRDPADVWLDIRSTTLREPVGSHGKRRTLDAVLLTITQQPFPEGFQARAECQRRELLLNEGFYFTQRDDIDPGYKPPPPLPDTLETYDFLWFIAGDGVLVVHGPSLAALSVK